MKRNSKRLLAVVMIVVSLLCCTGLNAAAFGNFGNFGDIFNDAQEKLGSIFTVSVDTKLYSHNDFDRTVTIAASLKSVDADEYFNNLNSELEAAGLGSDIYLYTSGSQSDDGKTQYIFTLKHGSTAELEVFTSLILPGSSLQHEANEAEIGPFCDSYQISETLDSSKLCSTLDAKCKLSCTYDGFEAVLSDGGGNVDGDSLSYADHTYNKGEIPVSFAFSKVIAYTVDEISVATDISSTGVISVAVALDFADVIADGSETGYTVGDSACRHFIEYVNTHEDSAYNHPKLRVEMHEGHSSASLENGETGTVSTDYRLVLRSEGTAESVSDVLHSVFGSGNNLTVSEGKVNSSNILFDRNSIVHNIDLTQLCTEAGIEASSVNYSFSGSSGSKLVDLSINSKSVDVKDNAAAGSADSAVFKVLIDYESLDLGAVIIAVLIGAAALCLAAFILKLMRRRSGKKRQIKSTDLRYEAVKSVALALVPEEQRASAIEVPSELMNRPTIVIKPKSDDGLDDDDDDPEGVILFSMMLRILLMVQLVLFFFPYFNVSRNSVLNSVDTITGLDLFLGFKIGETAIEPDRFAIVLFALPLVMLFCLMARRVLPKLALPLALSASSVFSAYYLLDLNNSIYDRLSPAIEAAASSGAFVSQPVSQTGYDYSLVIYVVLAIGGIVLLLSNIMAGIALRRQKREEEMRRFEK